MNDFSNIYESVLNPKTRRVDGIHFTTTELIHRVIDPLFLNDLQEEFSKCDSAEKLKRFHEKMSELVFFDPACGSGNFLVEIFSSLYMLETEIISKLNTERKLSVKNFYGIELNDFSCTVARVSLMLVSNSKTVPNIFHGNSLRIDWKKILPDKKVYIVGNPPFIGYSLQTAEQKSDVKYIFQNWRGSGKMDYAACWFKKSADFIQNTRNEAAFVATSSICQGEAVGFLWKKLFDAGIRINFAWKKFEWDSVAKVHCVIVGFSNFDRQEKFTYDDKKIYRVQNINAYLRDLPNICVESRTNPISRVPRMILGNLPRDGGNLIVESADYDRFIATEPRAGKYLRKFIGAEEFLKNRRRYCLWLVNAPEEVLNLPAVKTRIDAVKNFRLSSKRQMTRDSAKIPWLFSEIRQPRSGNYIVIPATTSSARKYIPFDFVSSEIICSDAVLIIPNANLYLFGILSSVVHMEWMRLVSGYLGISYRYSASIVYNNFPFPKYASEIESTARKILDVRKKYSESLSKMYKKFPADLLSAHEENDRAVLKSYGFSENISVDDLLSNLLRLYEKFRGR